PNDVRDQRRGGIVAQRKHLAFDRPHRREQMRWNALYRTRPCAGRKHHAVGRYLRSVGQNNSGDAVRSGGNCRHRLMLIDYCTGFLGSAAKCQRESTIVHLMVLRTEHRAGELAGEMWLAPAGLRCSDPVYGQAQLLLEHEVMLETRLIVWRQGDDERSFRAQLN